MKKQTKQMVSALAAIPLFALPLMTQAGGRPIGIESTMIPEDPYYGEQTVYQFTYTGDQFRYLTGDQNTYELRKEKNFVSANPIVSQFDITKANLQAFEQAGLSYLVFKENHEFGYEVHLDLENDFLSINKNWEQWPDPYADCFDESCWNSLQIAPTSIPDDETLLLWTSDFINKYGIKIDQYGAPVIDKYWEKTNDQYVYDTVQVVYPLLIEGKPVVNEQGAPYGMNVDVNIRYGVVESAWNIKNYNYETIPQEATLNTDELIEWAQLGGVSYYDSCFSQHCNLETVSLNTPTLGYAVRWLDNNGDNEYTETIVPAYIFDVTFENKPPYKILDKVVVPAVGDELMHILPFPEPIPFDEEFAIEEKALMVEDTDAVMYGDGYTTTEADLDFFFEELLTIFDETMYTMENDNYVYDNFADQFTPEWERVTKDFWIENQNQTSETDYVYLNPFTWRYNK